MDIEAYIESGILEQYVLGNCSDEECKELMTLAKRYPEIQSEIEAIENSLIALAEENALNPDQNKKPKLFEALADENKTYAINRTNNSSVKPFRIYLAAASVALLISLLLNISFYRKLKVSESALIAISKEKAEFAGIIASDKQKYSALEEQIGILQSADIVKVKLSGLKLIPGAEAIVYYNGKNSDVYLHINNLPVADTDKQYQLWAIIDGKPVDAGVFDSGSTLLKMKKSANAVAFAVTIEKKGGSQVPSLEQMVLLGNVNI